MYCRHFSTAEELCEFANNGGFVVVQIVSNTSGLFTLFYKNP